MTFLQNWPLAVLLAALLPIIIHMLNRLRYRTVQWAAMIFLLKANRAATRRAKIRQYLLLLFRCLVLLWMFENGNSDKPAQFQRYFRGSIAPGTPQFCAWIIK